jgi:hypothetical protein
MLWRFKTLTFLRFVTLITLFLVSLSMFFSLNNIQTKAQTTTSASLIVQNINLILGNFEINPANILINERLVFSLVDIKLNSGQFAVGLTCQMFLTAPDNSQVVLTMLVDNNGTCTYDSNFDLTDQGVTLVSGDVGKLNTLIGQGQGYVVIDYAGDDFTSNEDSYTVSELTLVPAVFDITPNNIRVGEDLTFSLIGARFSNGNFAQNLECRHFLTAPDNSQIVLSGSTNSDGDCIYTTSSSIGSILSIEASAAVTQIISGDTTRLNNIVGFGSGYGEVYYNNITYRSNLDTYNVTSTPPIIEQPVEAVREVIRILTRTGGGRILVVILLSSLIIVLGAYVSLKDPNHR